MSFRIFTASLLMLTALGTFSQTGLKQQEVISNTKSGDADEGVSFFGKITNALNGEPLPGASLYISDARIGAISDENGKFFLRNVPKGHHLVEVSYTGFRSLIEHIDITANTEKNFSLTPSIVENEGVTVTGVSNATSIRKAPIPLTSMRRAELLSTAGNNIIDMLSHNPGVSNVSTGPAISKPIIRGLGYNRVVVINDGVRQEGQQWGDEHGIEIDEASVYKAEILKGPASLMYGSDALAGVINLITNVPVAEGTIKGNLLTNFQTNNRLNSFHSNIAGNRNGINWNLYGSLKSAGDYKNRYDGRVLNSRFNEKNYGGYIGINKSWGFSHLIFSSFDQELGLIEGDRDDATGKFILYAGSPLERIASVQDLRSRSPFIPNQQILHKKLISDNSFAIKNSRLKINAGFQNNQRIEFGNPEDAEEKELFFDLNTFTYNVQWHLPAINEWHVTAGVNGMSQVNRNKGEEVIIPEYSLFDWGGFAFVQRFWKKTTLSGGLRFDKRDINTDEFFEGSDLKFESISRSFSNFSGSIGVSYEPADYLTLKANVARGFRAPNMAELTSNGAHEGTNRYEYGDSGLKSETSLQLDGGVQIEYEHVSLGLNAFFNKINNFVYYRKLISASGGDSLINVDGEDLPAFRFDHQDARLSGLEFTFDLHPHPLDWLHLDNSVSFVRGRFDAKVDGTDNLPLIPAPRWLSELKASFIKAGNTFHNLYVKVEMDKTFEQNKAFFAYGTETVTPGYTLLNAGIGTDITAKNKTLFSIHISAQNLTDAAYQNHLSRLKYTDENTVTGRAGVFNPGRNYSVKLNIPIQFSGR